MEKTTLTQAIHASQILLMLQPSFRYTKPAVKLLSVVRSGIDEAVATLVATERSPTRLDNAQNDAEHYIETVERQLCVLMGHFNVPAVVQGKLPTSIMAKKGTRTDILVKTLEKLVSIRPKPPSLAIFQMMSNNNPTAVAARGEVIRTFSSVVRHTYWMDVLVTLGLNPTATGVTNTMALNTRLTQTYSSNGGVAKLDENVAKLLGTVVVPCEASQDQSVDTAVVADNEFVLTVALTSTIAGSNKDVKRLFSELSKDASNANVVALLFQEATTPVALTIGCTAEQVRDAAQKKLNTLVNGLEKQVAAHVKVKAEKLEAQKKKETDAAIKALKGLGVHLKTLAKHPELLAQALEAAKSK